MMKKIKLSIGVMISLAVITSLIFYYTSVYNHNTTQDDSFTSAIEYENSKEFENTKTINMDANYITFSDVNELDTAADLIIIGTPTQIFEERDHKDTYFDDGTIQDFYTLTDIRVDKVIKSKEDFELDSKGHLTIIEPIGYQKTETQQIKITRENYMELEREHQYIIFLQQNSEGTFAIINVNLGKFDLSSTKTLQLDSSAEQNEYEKFKSTVLEKYNL